jgi:hypothetical protein
MPQSIDKWYFEKTGAAEGTRTPDPIITNDVLYQLSYSGHSGAIGLDHAGMAGLLAPDVCREKGYFTFSGSG